MEKNQEVPKTMRGKTGKIPSRSHQSQTHGQAGTENSYIYIKTFWRLNALNSEYLQERFVFRTNLAIYM